jgi:hypothetical protein
LFVLGVVVFGVLRDVAELPGLPDSLRDLSPPTRRQLVELGLEVGEAFWCEDDVLGQCLCSTRFLVLDAKKPAA